MKSCDRSGFGSLSTGRNARWARAASAVIGAGFALPASAHIHLLEPPSWVVEGFLGDPQKEGPCGIANPSPSDLTGAVTTYHPGDTVHFRWVETIPHDGHYRVALALTSRDELTDPKTTSDSNNNALTAEIQDPPTLPILMDGVYVHKASDVSLGQEYNLDVTLPNVTCDKCTLQLTQFMAHHAPGYFYYHCVDIKIVADAPVDADAGGPVGDDASVGEADAGLSETPDATATADLGEPVQPGGGSDATTEAPDDTVVGDSDATSGPPMSVEEQAARNAPPAPDATTSTDGTGGGSSGGCQAGPQGATGLAGLVFGLLALIGARRRMQG